MSKKHARDEMQKVNENTRSMLIAKIRHLQHETSETLKNLSYEYSNIYRAIKMNEANVQRTLTKFLDYCESCVQFISTLPQYFTPKQFHTPLESLLAKPNPSFESIKGPELVLQDSYTEPIRVCTSTIAHVLNNYNWHLTLEDDKIFIIGPSFTYNYKDFKQDIDITTRYMIVSDSKLLVAGGMVWKDFSAYIDIKENKARIFKKLKVPRYKHAMAWLNGYPAVFGGVSETGECLSTVEVLDNTEWKMHSKLNSARCNLTAVSSLNTVYIIGGTSDYEGFNMYNNIEKWENGWVYLSISLPFSCCNVGVINFGTSILLFGGKSENDKCVGAINFDLTDGLCQRLASFDDVFFKNNTLVLGHTFVKGKCFKKHCSDKQFPFDFNLLTGETIIRKD